jgi:hypothetical protein
MHTYLKKPGAWILKAPKHVIVEKKIEICKQEGMPHHLSNSKYLGKGQYIDR